MDRNGVDQHRHRLRPGVAPHAGAWIETCSTTAIPKSRSSRPSRRGVDRNLGPAADDDGLRASPLTQGRGSKLTPAQASKVIEGSPLTQGRGSKLINDGATYVEPTVAPHAGAWIETPISTSGCGDEPSRPSRRGVDRNILLTLVFIVDAGRPSRRGVDRNLHGRELRAQRRVAPHAGAWIET